MCLTIPKQVISVNQRDIKVRSGKKTEKVGAIIKVKKGDWVLTINNIAIKRISKKDAKEIIELLEKQPRTINSVLSKEFKKIIEASYSRQLTKREIVYLLNTKGNEYKALLSEANTVRKAYLKDFICIHGIIEFSNYCRNDCLYCGLRCQNKNLQRYRMTPEEIIETAQKAVDEKGYKLLVLQSGEDYYYTDEMLENIIKKIKEKCRVFIFISIGERGRETYRKIKDAGASGVLFRFETSNLRLFEKLHPKGKSLKKRYEHLKFFKELGYFVATGSMIGLPEQKNNDIYKDIKLMQKWANMISMGPFIPTDDTPLGDAPNDEKTKQRKIELNLKMIAILRLLMKNVKIPVVTALETLAGEEGRKRSLLAGANALMFNLTPSKYRPLYKIYSDKFYQKKEKWEHYGLFKFEESYKMLEERMRKEIKI